MKLKTFTSIGLCLSLLAMTGCNQETDADLIAEAQLCLDKATSDNAQNCLSSIAGLQSAESYSIRCSADFIREGFDSTDTLMNALNSLTTSQSNTASMLSVLVFKKNLDSNTLATSATNADKTFSYCAKSGQKGLSLIAAMAKSATQVAGIASSISGIGIDFSNPSSVTPEKIVTALDSLKSDPTATAAVGTTIQTVYNTTCTSGSMTSQDICGLIDNAATKNNVNINNASGSQVGNALMQYWACASDPTKCSP